MATLSNLTFESFGSCRAIGKNIPAGSMMQQPNPIPALWDKAFETGLFAPLEEFNTLYGEDAYIGFMYEMNAEGSDCQYMIGMFLQPGTLPPAGYDVYDVPACAVAKAWIAGQPSDVFPSAHELTEQALREAGYVPDYAPFCGCEVYTCARYCVSREDGSIVLDYYIPCKKA